MKLVINYTIFALIATAANLLSQDITTSVYSGAYAVTLSIFIGTAVGLLVKYLQDKKYIFNYQVRDISHDARTFFLYTLMGVVTTLIFWAFEFGFNAAFETKTLRYVGAVIGLGIGYWIKYHLDKRFVFVRPT